MYSKELDLFRATAEGEEQQFNKLGIKYSHGSENNTIQQQ